MKSTPVPRDYFLSREWGNLNLRDSAHHITKRFYVILHLYLFFPPWSLFVVWIIDEMDAYANKEKAKMHYMYRTADDNVKEAQRLYQERFSTRCVSDARIFQRLFQQLYEMGSFSCSMQDTGRGRSVRTPSLTDGIVLRIVQHSESRALLSRWRFP